MSETLSVSIHNLDSLSGMIEKIPENSIDMIFTDPPYGIKGETLDVMYNRDESRVIPGYIDVPLSKYADWSLSWIQQCERVLRPGGSMYIVSGYTNLHHVLNALHSTSLNEINHLIAQYSFGVYTKRSGCQAIITYYSGQSQRHHHKNVLSIRTVCSPTPSKVIWTDCPFRNFLVITSLVK